MTDRDIASGLLISASTVRTCTRFVKEELDSALNERPRPRTEAQVGGQTGSTSDSHRVQRRTRRTRGLDDPTACRQGGGDGVCREHLPRDGAPDTQKNELKPWKKKEWCIPEVSGEFVARMEDVLDLYHADYDPDHPVVCFDETSRQLVADKRPVIGAKPGRVERYDYEYKRNGTRNLFMFCEPKAGWRHVEVTERRTAVDFAHQMRWLVDDAYPHTETIRLVLDNLNTPSWARCTMPSSQPKRGASPSAWSSTTLLYTAVGTWLKRPS